MKGIHIRLEIYDNELSSPAAYPPIPGYLPAYHLCCAIGVTVPIIRINRRVALTSDSVSRTNPRITFSLTSLQVYCDYGCESYVEDLDSPVKAQVFNEFTTRYASEVHSGLLLPFDLEIVLDCEVRQRIGMIIPKLTITAQKLRFAVDPTQIKVLKDLLEAIARASKRALSLARLNNVFNSFVKPPPILRSVGGMHILPQLLIDGRLQYPSECGLMKTKPMSSSSIRSNSSLVCYFKSHEGGEHWAARMWKHVLSLVLRDLRLAKPLGRWMHLIKLVYLRKEYSHIYSRFLRKSKTSGKIIFFAGARIHHSLAMKMFKCEMILSVPTIIAFRQLGMLIAVDELLKNKVRKLRLQDASDPSTKISNTWNDLLRINSELIEAHCERYGSQPEGSYDASDDDIVATARNDVPRSDSEVSSRTSGRGGSGSGGFLSRLGMKVGLVSKEFSSSDSATASTAFGDDLDFRVLKKGESAVLSDLIKYLDSDSSTEESMPYLPTMPEMFAQPPGKTEIATVGQIYVPTPRDIWTSLKPLEGDRPHPKNIIESVNWVVNALRTPVHVYPPVVSITILESEIFLRTPKQDSRNMMRKNLLSLASKNLRCNIDISSSLTADGSSGKQALSTMSASFPTSTFIPLSNALIQIGLSISSLQASVHLHDCILKPVSSETITQHLDPIETGEKSISAQRDKVNGQVVRMIYSKEDTEFFVSTFTIDSTQGKDSIFMDVKSLVSIRKICNISRNCSTDFVICFCSSVPFF